MDHDECIFVALAGCGALTRSKSSSNALTFEIKLPKCVDVSLDDAVRACARHARTRLGDAAVALRNGVIHCSSHAAAEKLDATVQQAKTSGGACSRRTPSSDYVAVLRDIAERASKLSDVQPCEVLEVNERGVPERGRSCGVRVGDAALHFSARPCAKRLRSVVGPSAAAIDVKLHKRTCPDVASLTALAFAARQIPSPWSAGDGATPKRVATSAAQLVVRSRVKAVARERAAAYEQRRVPLPIWTPLYFN